MRHHMSKVCITSILDKVALGTQLRWARAEAQALATEGHKDEYEELQRYLDHADIAVALVDKKAKDMKKEVYMKHLQALRDFGVVFPTRHKEQLFYKYCDDRSARFDDESVVELMTCVLPWQLECDKEDDDHDDGPHDNEFDVLAPRLSALDDSAEEKAAKCKARLFAWLIAGIEAGEEHAEAFCTAIRSSWEFLEANMAEEEVEAFDVAVDIYMKASRAIVQLCTVSELPFKAELEEVMASLKRRRQGGGHESNFGAIESAIQKNAFYSGLQEDFAKNKNKLAQHIPTMKRLSADLGSVRDIFDKPSKILEALDALQQIEADLPAEAVKPFRDNLGQAVVQVAEEGLKAIQEFKGSLATKRARAEALEQMVDKSVQRIAQVRPALHPLHTQVSTFLADMSRESASEIFQKQAQEFLNAESPDVDTQKAISMKVAIDDFLQQYPEGDDNRLKYASLVDELSAKVTDVLGHLADHAKARPLIDLISSLLKGTPSGHEKMMSEVAVTSAWVALHESCEAWRVLADSAEERAAKDTDIMVIRAVLQALACASEAAAQAEKTPLAATFADAIVLGKFTVKESSNTNLKKVDEAVALALGDLRKVVAGSGESGSRWWGTSDLGSMEYGPVMELVARQLGSLPGSDIVATIDKSLRTIADQKGIYQMFNELVGDSQQEEAKNAVQEAMVTKFSAMTALVLAEVENNQPTQKQKRILKKIRAQIVGSEFGVKEKFPRALWAKLEEFFPTSP